jgi:hypothetical protein
LGRVVEGQVKKRVEVLEAILRRIIRGAERTAEERINEVEIERPKWGDYEEALLDEVMPNDDVTEEEDEEPSLVASNTTVTLKGVLRTTTTQQRPSALSPPTPSETALAVGAGAQLFPNKGVPCDPPDRRESRLSLQQKI